MDALVVITVAVIGGILTAFLINIVDKNNGCVVEENPNAEFTPWGVKAKDAVIDKKMNEIGRLAMGKDGLGGAYGGKSCTCKPYRSPSSIKREFLDEIIELVRRKKYTIKQEGNVEHRQSHNSALDIVIDELYKLKS